MPDNGTTRWVTNGVRGCLSLLTKVGTTTVPALAHSALVKGKAARNAGQTSSDATELELVAYSRAVLDFVHEVLNIAAQHGATVFAAVVDRNAPRPAPGLLRKDYVYLTDN